TPPSGNLVPATLASRPSTLRPHGSWGGGERPRRAGDAEGDQRRRIRGGASRLVRCSHPPRDLDGLVYPEVFGRWPALSRCSRYARLDPCFGHRRLHTL